jgi:hypothetical protein
MPIALRHVNSIKSESTMSHRLRLAAVIAAIGCTLTPLASGQVIDEAQVPPYTLPDPLVMADGTRVTTVERWRTSRRPELQELITREMYGRAPGRPGKMAFQRFDHEPSALGGKATREQVAVFFNGDPNGPRMDLLVYVPNAAKGPVPAILGLNFWGNHAINADPGIRLSQGEMESNRNPYVDLSGVKGGRATEASRGINARQWPVDMILDRGYVLVTAYRGDIAPDYDAGFKLGIPAAYPELQGRGDNFATVAAWAWALSRALDYLETDSAIDAHRVAVFGWSRLGKAALWAGAIDERFAMVLSHESGAGGAALSKRKFGEDVERLNRVFPHWFCANFRKYSNHEEDLPFDQHEVIALIAPRPVCIGSAEQDKGADPKGEFLAARAADPVYRLFDTDGLPAETWPAVNQPVHGRLGYHLRPGGHDVKDYDWAQYLAFADRHLMKKPAGGE